MNNRIAGTQSCENYKHNYIIIIDYYKNCHNYAHVCMQINL